MCSEILDYFGVWSALGQAYGMTVAAYTIARAVAREVESAWATCVELLDLIWSVLALFGEPRRVSMLILGCAVTLRALGDRGSEDEATSST